MGDSRVVDVDQNLPGLGPVGPGEVHQVELQGPQPPQFLRVGILNKVIKRLVPPVGRWPGPSSCYPQPESLTGRIINLRFHQRQTDGQRARSAFPCLRERGDGGGVAGAEFPAPGAGKAGLGEAVPGQVN